MSAEANPRTGNVLVLFRPEETDARRLVEHAGALANGTPSAPDAAEVPAHDRPRTLHERHGDRSRARIAVRGLDRDPRLGPMVVRRLEAFPGVRAKANPLTGRVLVEFERELVPLEDLVAAVADVELPELPDEEWPEYPLDPTPVVLSGLRLTAALVGLALVAARQIRGRTGGVPGAVRIAAIFSVLQSTPYLRRLLAPLLGHEGAEVALALPSVVALAAADSPLGLVLIGADALRILTEEHARRQTWRRYEEALRAAPPAVPGAVVRLESGERSPLDAVVIEGAGIAVAEDGLPRAIAPGDDVGAGARLLGGPFVLRLRAHAAFVPMARPDDPAPTVFDRYEQAATPLAIAYTLGTAIATRSTDRILAAMLLVNPRAAIIGMRGAEASAIARATRAGAIVVGTRPDRRMRRPDVLLFANTRLFTDGLEVATVIPRRGGSQDLDRLLGRAARVLRAAGSPWAAAFRAPATDGATDARSDGGAATGTIDGVRYTVRPLRGTELLSSRVAERHAGELLLILSGDDDDAALLVLRPRLSPSLRALTALCADSGIRIAVLGRGEPAVAGRLARRAGVAMIATDDAVDAIYARQMNGRVVAFVSDDASDGDAFASCDLAIGVAELRTRFTARADIIAPDLDTVHGVVEATVLREEAVRDVVALSSAGNLVGAALGRRGVPTARAGRLVESIALAALGVGWVRLHGGARAPSVAASLPDPHPEQWARRSPDEVLRALGSSPHGLTGAQITERREELAVRVPEHRAFLQAIGRQLDSPITAVWIGGAVLSLVLGAGLDVVIILGTLGVNVLVGAWQERKSGRVAEALRALEGHAGARVLRAGVVVEIRSDELVVGDVLLLAPGDRVGADARLLYATGLEVDESALTGESLPIAKAPAAGAEGARIVLAGSDVAVGRGRAVVVAVGANTRMGATAAALGLQGERRDLLAERLGQLLKEALPISVAGGVVVALAGMLRGQGLLAQLAVGSSVVLAAVPEGLPLLAGLGQAAAARRLSRQGAIVRRLTAVEALGRVDVACVDKTGTLTEGRLSVTVVATAEEERHLPSPMSPSAERVLLAAALASPHPDEWSAAAHATDMAVIRGAEAAGLRDAIRAPRGHEASFDPARSFHAATVQGRLYVKGAPEVLLERSTHLRRGAATTALDAAERAALLRRATSLAQRGLRVLLVAEGAAADQPSDVAGLEVLGLLGISDPLRPDVAPAVARCRAAGIRVVMLTGDHPATARTIAAEAGLLDGEVLTGPELAQLENGELDARLEEATVIARATPLDKLRIVESLQRRGHTVAMTGDGVNDAPALRLADVGVAMGRSGTEVARQTADVILVDDAFPTLVEALVEGRGFWGHTRRALGLLLGGNLGELGVMAGATLLGGGTGLTVPQILAVNLVTDLLPAIAISVQRPEHRDLQVLAREGAAALGAPLRGEILRRATATALPSLAAFAFATTRGGTEAQGVAFASVVSTQLAQIVALGRSEGRLTRSVAGAAAASTALLGATFAVPSLRRILGLRPLSPVGWTLVAGATLLAPLVNRTLASGDRDSVTEPIRRGRISVA